MKNIKSISIILLMVGMLTSCIGNEMKVEETSSTGDKEKITVILDYMANTNHTGLYVALKNGYYEEMGFDVEIIEPTEGATATLIAVGKGDFGVSYQEDVTMARSAKEALPIKAIAAVIQHNTSGFATYSEKNITTPKDFEGKTYVGWAGSGEAAVLEAVMSEAGADFSTLDMVISDGAGFEILKDRADIMWFYEGWDGIKAKRNDFPFHYMELRQLDVRLDYYTPVIITNDGMIREKPETIRKFLTATEKGYEYAIQNPVESAEILWGYTSDYDLEMLKDSQEFLSTKYKEDTNKWGMMKDEVWNNYTEFLVEYGVIQNTIPASDCYTNEFLTK